MANIDPVLKNCKQPFCMIPLFCALNFGYSNPVDRGGHSLSSLSLSLSSFTFRSCGSGQLDIRTPEAELDVEQQRQLPQGRQARQPALHHVRGRGVRPLRLRQHHQGEDQGEPTAVCLSESQPIQGHLLILYLPGCGDQAAECEEDHEGSEAQARGL